MQRNARSVEKALLYVLEMQDLAPLRALATRSPQQLTWLLKAHCSSGASCTRLFASSAIVRRAQAAYQSDEDYCDDWTPRQSLAPAVSRDYSRGRHTEHASEEEAERYAALLVNHSGALVTARTLEVLAHQEPLQQSQPAIAWHALQQQRTQGQQGAPHSAASPSGLRPLVLYHSRAHAGTYDGQEAVLPAQAHAPVAVPPASTSMGDVLAAAALGLVPQDQVVLSAFMDGAVEAIDQRRKQYFSRRGLDWPQQRKRQQPPAQVLAAAADLDAVPESTAAALAADLPDDSEAQRAAGGPAGPSGSTASARRPKKGDEVELICQSLAFGGKV